MEMWLTPIHAHTYTCTMHARLYMHDTRSHLYMHDARTPIHARYTHTPNDGLETVAETVVVEMGAPLLWRLLVGRRAVLDAEG